MKPASRIKLHIDDNLATLESFLLEQKALQESEGMESWHNEAAAFISH